METGQPSSSYERCWYCSHWKSQQILPSTIRDMAIIAQEVPQEGALPNICELGLTPEKCVISFSPKL